MDKNELKSNAANLVVFVFKGIGKILKIVFIGFIMLWKFVGNAVKDAF